MALVSLALNWLKPGSDEIALDLFSGIGNFSLPFARRTKIVHAIEGDSDMVLRVEGQCAAKRYRKYSRENAQPYDGYSDPTQSGYRHCGSASRRRKVGLCDTGSLKNKAPRVYIVSSRNADA